MPPAADTFALMNKPNPCWSRNREIMPASAAPFALDLPVRLAQHNPRWSAADGPVGYWSAGVPLGNGDFGALIYGPPENLTLLLGKNDLWLRNNDRSYFPAGKYADLLKMYRAAFEALLPKDQNWADHFRPSTAINGGFLHFHTLAYHQRDNLSSMNSLTMYNWRQDPNTPRPEDILGDLLPGAQAEIVLIGLTPAQIREKIEILSQGRFVIYSRCRTRREQEDIVQFVHERAPLVVAA